MRYKGGWKESVHGILFMHWWIKIYWINVKAVVLFFHFWSQGEWLIKYPVDPVLIFRAYIQEVTLQYHFTFFSQVEVRSNTLCQENNIF